ncbi:MAG: hypothetical protein FWG91_05680 [Lachnospiraceae bacterium]|nr:hypothetical protein [Lachnospiraceae bacterium]
MTDLELTTRAKEVIDKLANGLDPYTSIPLSDDALLNDPRLIRCFFHISKKLNEIIANGGEVGRKSTKHLLPFRLSEEQKSKVAISETPLPISIFIEEIDKVIDTSIMKKCNRRAVTTWLVERGFLAEEIFNEKKIKTITPQSELVGIFKEERAGMRGSYSVVLYKKEAQQFILDSLNEIFDAL